VSQPKGKKVKALAPKQHDDPDVFWMSLEEAKQAIVDKYEFLAERYERKLSRGKGIT
jgi:hypothetical protein